MNYILAFQAVNVLERISDGPGENVSKSPIRTLKRDGIGKNSGWKIDLDWTMGPSNKSDPDRLLTCSKMTAEIRSK